MHHTSLGLPKFIKQQAAGMNTIFAAFFPAVRQMKVIRVPEDGGSSIGQLYLL